MVKVKQDLTGIEFGRLTVIRQVDDYVAPCGTRKAKWLCECNCSCPGNRIEVVGTQLKNGQTSSCGCYKKDRLYESTKKYNDYSEKLIDEHGEYYIGYTSNNQKQFYIDADDYDKIKDYCWSDCVQNNLLRIQAFVEGKITLMHKFLGFKNYDHIDRNELNNRKYNLRACTPKENSRNHKIRKDNTSGVIGVRYHTIANKWNARIVVDQKEIYLGLFNNKDDAIRARLQAEIKYFGEFAPQKHLYEQYGITRQND